MHSVELSTAAVKVNIKVINGSLSQNQCLQCVLPALMHAEISQCHWTMTAWSSWAMFTTKQNQKPNLPFFSESDLINDDSSSCLQILLTTDLQCNVFPFAKVLLNVCHCHLQVAMLQCLAKSSYFSVHWSIRMVHVKNYKTMSNLLELWLEYCMLFSGHVYLCRAWQQLPNITKEKITMFQFHNRPALNCKTLTRSNSRLFLFTPLSASRYIFTLLSLALYAILALSGSIMYVFCPRPVNLKQQYVL